MRRMIQSFIARLRASRARSDAEVRALLRRPPAPNARIKVVALLASERDRELLSRVASTHGWDLHVASTCGEAWEFLLHFRAPIALCDRDFPGAEWRDVVQMMSSASHLVYPILASRVADDFLWNEVIRHGGYDLVATPLKEEDVVRAIRLAWSYWSSAVHTPALHGRP